MKYRKLLLFIVIFLCGISSIGADGCDDTSKSNTVKIDKKDCVDYTITSSRLPNGNIIVKTEKNIYNNNKLFKSSCQIDTLPYIGKESVELYTDPDDEDSKKDTLVNKEYNIYFKIK